MCLVQPETKVLVQFENIKKRKQLGIFSRFSFRVRVQVFITVQVIFCPYKLRKNTCRS